MEEIWLHIFLHSQLPNLKVDPVQYSFYLPRLSHWETNGNNSSILVQMVEYSISVLMALMII
jgi:hypothetical protein